jgi:hypothetical protein
VPLGAVPWKKAGGPDSPKSRRTFPEHNFFALPDGRMDYPISIVDEIWQSPGEVSYSKPKSPLPA